MYLPLALLQASDDQTTLIMLAVVTLGVLIALGKNFFAALWEIITAPQASLAHHGQKNTLFFAVMVVFLGGLIGLLYLTFQQPQISSGFTSFAKEAGQQIAQGNSNPNYREIAGNWAADRIDNALQTYVVGNFIWFPIYMLVVWLINGILFFGMSKMFGTQTSLSDFLGALAYPYFFSAIASALLLPSSAKGQAAALFGQTPPQEIDVPIIIAGVLVLYAFVLLCMAVIQAAEISAGQFIVCLILASILAGGVGYYFMTQKFVPMADEFQGEVASYDPSKANFRMPGSGSYAPPPSGNPDMSAAPAPSAPSGDAPISGGGGAVIPSLE